MSRLTSHPFNKPSPFDFPRPAHPLSPPETESEIMAHNQATTSRPLPAAGIPIELDAQTLATQHSPSSIPPPSVYDMPITRPKKVSTLAYLHSGLGNGQRDHQRDRPAQRSMTKWLVVVIPPAAFSQETGRLGNTLSSGPPNRLSSGILMPLFPTMYGQLTAIAREFNFPSTAGICLYLHVSEPNFTFTPRISDESWQLLWGHLFEARSPAPTAPPQPQLPIGGRIEFDIDLRKARWYHAWITQSQRDSFESEIPVSVIPSGSGSHFRGESRTSFLEEQTTTEVEHFETDSATAHASGSPAQASKPQRHIPRKLSLLDRVDAYSVRSGVTQVSRLPSELSPPHNNNNGSYERFLDPKVPVTLTPIAQEEEPKTAKADLQSRVRTWRASSSLAPSPMAATGQTSLDPANMPNNVPLDSPRTVDEEEEGYGEINMDDYQWSVTSAGPPDYEPEEYEMYELESVAGWGRRAPPSIHLDRRLEGSVCLTPTTCTSWGPEDYEFDELDSPVSNVYRVPSPDLAQRMVEDCPPTPSTATSWGPPSEYPPSPYSPYRAPSVDLGVRGMGSRPVTPSTATSWGAPSWPPSRASGWRAPSPDLAERLMVTPRTPNVGGDRVSRLQFPYYDVFRGVPWDLVWPYHREQVETEQEEEGQEIEVPEVYVSAPVMSELAFPCYSGQRREFDEIEQEVEVPEVVASAPEAYASSPVMSTLAFPYYVAQRGETVQSEPWRFVWPYNGTQERSEVEVRKEDESPVMNRLVFPYYETERHESAPWKLVWPYNDTQRQAEVVREDGGNQGPALQSATTPAPTTRDAPLSPFAFPYYDAWRREPWGGVWPYQRALASEYPRFDIYPAVYPHLDIYPSVKPSRQLSRSAEVSTRATASYPTVDTHPAVYPHFEIYPGYVSVAQEEVIVMTFSVTLPAKYPEFDIYPAVYPWNLVSIYSATTSAAAPVRGREQPEATALRVSISPPRNSPRMKSPTPPMRRPSRSQMAPAVPPLPRSVRSMRSMTITTSSAQKLVLVKLPQFYPSICLYPAAYPHFDLYPPAASREEELNITPAYVYPMIAIYAPVYPHFDLYPAMSSSSKSSKATEIRLPSTGQAGSVSNTTELPAVVAPFSYPSIVIYPSIISESVVRHAAQRRLDMTGIADAYPLIRLYPTVYPFFEIYPGVVCNGENFSSRSSLSTKLTPRYPNLVIYSPVYPYFGIYETGTGLLEDSVLRQSVSLRLLAKYPAIDLYPAVYPHFDLYPSACQQHSSSGALSRRRRTHAELHRIVFSENPKDSPKTSVQRQSRTHRQLHELDFPDGVVSTPSGTAWQEAPRPILQRRGTPPTEENHQRRVSFVAPPRHGRTRSGTVSARPNVAGAPSAPLPPIPSEDVSAVRPRPQRLSGLPSNPAQSRRPMSMASKASTPEDSKRPSAISASRARILSSVSEDAGTGGSLGRAQSMVLPDSFNVSRPNLDRSSSLTEGSRRPPPRRRESLVAQRMKAFEFNRSSSDGSDAPTKLTMNALKEFPMPPPPPQPTGSRPVSRLDRSKYPFA